MASDLTPPMPADPTREERRAEKARLKLQRRNRRKLAKQGRKSSYKNMKGKGPGGKSGKR